MKLYSLWISIAGVRLGTAKKYGGLDDLFRSSKNSALIASATAPASIKTRNQQSRRLSGSVNERQGFIRRDQTSTCQNELDVVNNCVGSEECIDCVGTTWNSVFATNPRCIEVENAICPSIVSDCNCGDCVAELEDYYDCRLEFTSGGTCNQLDCLDPCNNELGSLVNCVPQDTQCSSCIGPSILSVFGDSTSCGLLESDICSVIAENTCECGNCVPEIVAWTNCYFVKVDERCIGEIECPTSPPTTSTSLSPTESPRSLPTKIPTSSPTNDLLSSPTTSPTFAPAVATLQPTSLSTIQKDAEMPPASAPVESPTRSPEEPVPIASSNMTSDTINSKNETSTGVASTGIIAGAAVGAMLVLCVTGLVIYKMQLNSKHPKNGPTHGSTLHTSTAHTCHSAPPMPPTQAAEEESARPPLSPFARATPYLPQFKDQARSRAEDQHALPPMMPPAQAVAEESNTQPPRSPFVLATPYLPQFKDQVRAREDHHALSSSQASPLMIVDTLDSQQSSVKQSQLPPSVNTSQEEIPVARALPMSETFSTATNATNPSL